MKLNNNTEIIIGPPGTGKTATLISMAKDLILRGVDPDQIGYISFTRQAVREASHRIMQATNQPADKFIGFKTLHAMVFWIMGKKHTDIIDNYNPAEISFLPKHADGNIATERVKVYAQLYNFHRMTGEKLAVVWERYSGTNSGTEEDFLEWIALYIAHKRQHSQIDFVDLIQEFIDRGFRFPFQYLFIDEAQDFSLDQWAAAARLACSSEKVIVAGDPDQSVFGWSGAKSCMLDELEGERRVLSQSFRLPSLPHTLAGRVLSRMGRSILYSPTIEKGRVAFILPNEIETLPLDNGATWFILCRNNYQVKQLASWLFKKRILFRGVSEANQAAGIEKYIRHIKWYEDAVVSGQLSPARKRFLKEECSNVDSGVANSLPWWQVFDHWPIDRIEYLRATRSQWNNVTVGLGTFHSSKGAEADNVVLLGDTTRRIHDALERGEPEEYRAIYVAMTRTRNNLFLVQPQGRYGIQWNQLIQLPQDLTNGIL